MLLNRSSGCRWSTQTISSQRSGGDFYNLRANISEEIIERDKESIESFAGSRLAFVFYIC